jgi:hypothetical protein
MTLVLQIGDSPLVVKSRAGGCPPVIADLT